MQPTPVTCKSCGTRFEGSYCNYCGEKVYHAHDKSIKHFLEEAFHFNTHFDTKFFRTLWLIFAKPGFVSKEYCDDKRKKYFSPVSLFLIGVVIYLLFPALRGLNITFYNHINNNNSLHLYFVQHWAEHKAAVENITIAELSEKFEHLSPKFSKVLLLTLIPLCAFALVLLFPRKRKYFFDHLMLSAEINSINLFLFFLILPALLEILNKIVGTGLDYGDNAFFLILHGVVLIVILIASFMRFYQSKFFIALFKAILFIILYMVALHIYRLIVFAIVMLFI